MERSGDIHLLRVRNVEGSPDDQAIPDSEDDEPLEEVMERAERAHVTGRFRLARDLFDRAHEMEPDNAEILVKLATSHHALGDRDEGWRWLDRALRVAPRAFDPWYSKGMFLMAEERHHEAIDAFGEASQRASGARGARAVNSLGLALLALGRRDEAIDAFERAFAADPSEVDALINRAVLDLEDGRSEQALTLLDQAIDRDPEAGIAHYNRARALTRLGRTGEAIEAIDAAERLDVRRALCHLQRARALVLEGREGEAEAILTELCRDPSPPRPAVRLLELLRSRSSDARCPS